MEMQHFALGRSARERNESTNNLDLPPIHSKESVAFYRDPFNKPEHEHTLRGMELFLFTFFYILAVCAFLALFETVLPVVWVYNEHFVEQQRREAIFNATNSEKLSTVLR
ncbi:hypothetical protein niasHT_009688 [Heterodera trifolii]|uniref:Uncharacterized protein n=1 Tax=Heterodera trifolii TaxID=157864 RepID=A0ABD2M6G0_9BILA